MQVSGAGTAPRFPVPAAPTGKELLWMFVSVHFPPGFHLSLTAVKRQRSGGGGAGLQAAVEGHAQ